MTKKLEDLEFGDEDLAILHKHVLDHIAECNSREEQWRMHFELMINSQEENTRAIKDLTKETLDVVQLHRDMQGAARIGVKIQNAAIWLTKWGAVGVALAAFLKWLSEHIDKTT